MTGVLEKRGEDTERHMREEDHVKAETEIEVTQLKAREFPGLPGAIKARKRQGRILP